MEHFMVELFVRGVVLCLLAALGLLLLRRSAAAYRHLLCVLALGGLLTLPLAQRLLPPLPVLQSPSVATPMTLSTTEAGRIAETNANAELPQPQEKPQPPIVPSESATVLPQDNASLRPHMAAMKPAVRQSRSWNAAPVLLALWGLGAITLLIRLMVALLRLRRLKTLGRQERLGSIPILVSERVDTPLTWGIRRHVILLPQALLVGDPVACESALRHEQAHIARWDWIWNLLAEIVCALCWFQPGAWWLRRRMRLESEHACDDRVLLSGITGPDYAAHLLQILRSVRINEVAPAMAHLGSMEERMQHILDTKRPRRAQTKWLAASASLALVLLSCAALRVSARPAATKADADAPVLKSGRPDMTSQPSKPDLPADAGTPDGAEPPFSELPPLAGHGNVPAIQPGSPMAQAQPGTALPQGSNAPTTPVLPVGHIVWGDIVDGLQPGFLLKTPAIPANRLTPLNSQVTYQVLVRNTTRRERVIVVECQDFTDMDPYLIPNDDIRQALSGDKIPEKYHALGVMELVEVFPAYPVKLAAGEAVVLPNVLSLYVGDADKQSYPRIEQIKPGRNWIVQPIAIHSLTPAEADEALAGEKSVKLTILGRDGKPSIRSTTWRAFGSGGKRLYAKIPLEIGTGNVINRPTDTPVRGNDRARGLEFGSRIVPSASSYQQGSGTPQNHAPIPATPLPDPIVSAGHIVWGDVMDGLQSGFLLKTPGDPNARRVPVNSKVVYQVLVRNTTRRERVIETECGDFQGMTPYLIPDGDLRQALGGREIPISYRAAALTDLATAFLGYTVKLGPGEAILLPDVLSLYVGDADKQSFPRVEQIKQGLNWIVQPVATRSLTPTEAAEDLASISSPYGNGINLTVLKRDGTSANRLGAHRGIRTGAKRLYAKISLEIGAQNVANPPLEMPIAWGDKVRGFQIGARIVPDASVFQVGNTITFQAFGRNLSGKDVPLSIGNFWKVNYKIQVQTLDGKPVYMERDAHNRPMVVAGYLAESLGNGATQEISKAVLKITHKPEVQTAGVSGEQADDWVEAVPLKPGRYRIRLVSWGVFGRDAQEPTSGWIPIEVQK